MTRAQAAERLRISGISTAQPEITDDVVLAILDNTARASAHATSTAYTVGANVISSTINGRLYRCIVAGTSGASAPSWPLAGAGRTGQRITDGTATWEDMGPAHAEIYDLNAASRECWLYRANVLSSKFDVSADGQSMKRSQVYDHAIAQARRYGWRGAL
jgi:hypothetical protein